MDLEFSGFLTLLKLTPKEFTETFSDKYIVSNNYEVILTMIKLGFKKEMILNFFKIMFPNLEFVDSQFKCGGIPVTFEEYSLMLKFIDVSCAEIEFDDFMKNLSSDVKSDKELSKIEQKMKEQQDKVDKAKKKKKNKSGEKITIDQIVIGILYEFPSFTLDRIYDMNMFTLLLFWTYVSKVVDTQIQVVAAGNGLTKEFTYFVN